MSFFSKSSFVFWPHKGSTEIYSQKKENNTISFDIDLWQKQDSAGLQPLCLYLKKNKIKSAHFLLPDDIVATRSFIYDSQINSIAKKEIVALAKDFVNFDIEESSIESSIIPGKQKTTICARIYDRKKLKIFFANLSLLGLKDYTFGPLSQAIADLVKTFYQQEYFFLFPLSSKQFLLILAKGDMVFLTTSLKGSSLDIQKIINYSKLYFSTPIKKIFIPTANSPELISTTSLEKTNYDSSQIAQNLSMPTNLPLPVIGSFMLPNHQNTDIIKNMKEDQKNTPNTLSNSPVTPSPSKQKKILPVIAVFIFTAALASVVIWFVLNRSPDSVNPQIPGTANPTTVPTAIPTAVPTIAEIDKDLKIQVLNATEVNGLASFFKEKLVDLGFTDVAVGNSSESLSVNQVMVKEENAEQISAYFKSKVGEVFPATYDPSQTDDDTYDVVFIIGTNIKESAPTVEPTETETPDSPDDSQEEMEEIPNDNN